MGNELILKYFPQLSDIQKQQFAELKNLYEEWNRQINVISRKDIDHLYERHVLHALGVAKVQKFVPGSSILDIGTGGGFPGVPLAILFPDTEFLLVDSIGKKIKVVNEVSSAICLSNVRTMHERAEKINETFDFDLARGDKPLAPLMSGKTLVIITSSGEFGFEKGGINEAHSHLVPHLRTLSKYLGVDQVFEVASEYQEFADERHTNSMNMALQKLSAIARVSTEKK